MPGRSQRSQQLVEDMGILSGREQHRTDECDAVAATYPMFRRPDWTMAQVIEGGRLLAKIPEHAAAIAALLDQPAIPPLTALATLANAGTMSVARRRELLDLAQSQRSLDRRNALAALAALPPMPPPQLELLRTAIMAVERAQKDCPAEQVPDRLARALEILRECREQIVENYDSLKHAWRRGSGGNGTTRLA